MKRKLNFLFSFEGILSRVLLVAIMIASIQQLSIAQTLTHSYTFDDGTANDVVGTLHGTANGSALTIADGKATVTGATGPTDGYISFDADALDLKSYSAITLEFKVESQNVANASYTMMAYFGNNTGGNKCLWFQPTRNGTESRAETNNGTTSVTAALAGTEVDDGKKHHVAVVLSSTALKYYLDGTKVAEAEVTADYITSLDTVVANLFKGPDGWADANYNGSIDEFNIYDGEVSAADINTTAINYLVGEPKKVAYVTSFGGLTGFNANDPIAEMLENDLYIDLTVIEHDADDTGGPLDLSGYDAVIAQEAFGSSSAIYKRGATLGIGTIPVPFIHNKVYTMRDGRGFQDGATGSGGEVEGTIHLTVDPANQSNDLFKGVTFVGDSVQLFFAGGDDNGGGSRTKGLQYATDVVISASNTLLGSGVNDPANATVCINDIPAGSTVGSETTQARMIAVGMNYGAISKWGGNLTSAGMTIWRNAVYSLTGIPVPDEAVPATEPAMPAALTHSYTFDDGTAADVVGDVDGSLNGSAVSIADGKVTVTGATGPTDGYVTFDGAALALNTYNAITLEAKVLSQDLGNNDVFTMLAYFGNNTGGNRCFWYQPTRRGTTASRAETNNGSATINAETGAEVDDGKPHHVVAELTKGSLKYYLDGALVAETPATEDFISTLDTVVANLFKGPDGWADPNYNGSIDEFNIYNGILHPDSIAAEANAFIAANSKPPVEVILVTKDENAIDSVVVQAIAAEAGFNVTPYYPAGGAGVITEADLAALDAADVVIIGRNIGSGDVGSAMAAWDMVKAPVLSMNLWGMRNNRAMWINSNSALNEVSNPDTVLQATVVTDDPVLGGASGTFGFWEGFFSAFGDDGNVEDDGGNGTVILKADNGTVLFARWEPGVEFYEGAGHSAKGHRTFIGNGNDNTENNYFGFTEAGKTIFFNELNRMAELERPSEPLDVIFVTKDENAIDTTVMQAIDAHPDFNLIPYYPAGGAGIITDADQDALNEADVVVMGRNIGSGDVGSAMAAWDKVYAPVVSMNLWGLRSNRAMWVNSDQCTNVVSNPDTVLQATVVTDVPELGDATGTFDYWDGFFSVFAADADVTDDVGNGQAILETSIGTLLYARWDKDVEFYPGAGHQPNGARSYIGNGNDNTENNYFGFTEAGKTIFFNELKRMGAIEFTVPEDTAVLSDDATLSALEISAGTLTFDAATHSYDVKLPAGTTDVPTVTTATKNDANASDPVITQATALPGTATVMVTAEDGTTSITYEINFSVESVVDPNKLSILLVGTTTNAPDLLIKDSLEMWGYNVELINGGDHDVSYYESGNYDMVFISESIGSSTASAYGTAGFTIPCFLSEPYALNKTDIELGALTDAAQSASVESMIIEDVDNDILEDQYASGQVVRIFDPAIDPTWTDAVFQYEFTLNPDVVFTKLGTPDVSGLSDPSLWVGDPSFVLIEDFPANSNGIEIVIHAFHNGASSTGTDDYWNQVRRSVWYLLDDFPVDSTKISSSDLQSNLNIYPNPTKAETTVDFTLEQDGAVEIMLLNMNGQLVRTIDSKFRAAGKNTAKFNVGDLSNGMYLIQLRGAGLERTERLFINN